MMWLFAKPSRLILTFTPALTQPRARYWYFILNEPVPSVFYRRYAWHVRKPLDVEAMRDAAALLVGMHDYSSFQAREREDACMVREVKRVRLKRVGPSAAV